MRPRGVQLDDLRKLRARASDDGDVEAELAPDQALDVSRDVVCLARARDDDVAALEIRLRTVETGASERVAQRRHRDPIPRAEVDPTEQEDVARHRGLRRLHVLGGLPDHGSDRSAARD